MTHMLTARKCRRFAVRWCAVPAIWCALLVQLVHATDSERLVLHSGDVLDGRSLTVESGYLRWQLLSGDEVRLPLEWVDRIEPASAVRPAGFQEIPPAPLDPALDPPFDGTAPPVSLPEANADSPPVSLELADPTQQSAEPSWTDQVPFISTLCDGYEAVSAAYIQFNDLASLWTRRIELSGQFLDGNTQTDLIALQVQFENSTPERMRQIDVGGQRGRNQSIQTANRWYANGNFDWRLNDNDDRWIMFFTSKNEYDAPANLNYRGTLSYGLGYRFFNEAKRRLITRIGPAYTVEVFRDPNDHRESPDLFGEVEMRWPLLKRMSVEQKVRVQPSLLDFKLIRVFSTSGVLMDLDDKDRWKLRLGLNYTYNSEPSPGRVPSDYTTNLSLVYTRK